MLGLETKSAVYGIEAGIDKRADKSNRVSSFVMIADGEGGVVGS